MKILPTTMGERATKWNALVELYRLGRLTKEELDAKGAKLWGPV